MFKTSIQDRYHTLLADYLFKPAETRLAEAAALGRELVFDNYPPEDIVEIHEEALVRFVREHPGVSLKANIHLTSAPLMELLMAFGMAYRERLAHHQMEKELRLAAIFFENTPDGVLIMNSQANIITCNKSFSAITGYAMEEVLGERVSFLQSDQRPASIYQTFTDSLGENDQWQGEVWVKRKNGSTFLARLNLRKVDDLDGEIMYYVGAYKDITAQKRFEEHLHHRATHDELTNLPNRTLFYDRLEHALTQAKRYEYKMAVLFIDIDDFKAVNDSYGHGIGDLVLISVAERVSENLRQADTVARWGGDEFACILERIREKQDAANIAQKVNARMSLPFKIDGQEIKISLSIGISIYPENGEDYKTLLETADIAMYSAKKGGKNSFSI